MEGAAEVLRRVDGVLRRSECVAFDMAAATARTHCLMGAAKPFPRVRRRGMAKPPSGPSVNVDCVCVCVYARLFFFLNH